MNTGSTTPDNLIAGDFPRATAWVTVPSGSLKRGTVVTRAGAAMAPGGTPFGVLEKDTDASGGPATAVVYLSGEFARRHLILAGNADIGDADWDSLRALNIYVKDTVPAA